MSLTVTAFDHLVINVNDVAGAAAWYQRVLGMACEEFNPGHGKKPRVALKFGPQKINLRPMTADQEDWFTGRHPTPGSQDLCFLTQSSPQQVVEHLRACGIAIETGPVEKQGAKGALMSVYCRDPDGNLIEIASYVR
jgi:catechol 2,3-dioxygenase-like lactoylglutathione lyase family enzyme